MLGLDTHWSDAANTPAAFHGRDLTRRQERARRVAMINDVLHHYVVRVRDWHNTAYVVSTPTGKSKVVDHLGMLWAETAALTGRPCDPLDPRLLAALEGMAGDP